MPSGLIAALLGLTLPALFWLCHALGWPLWLCGLCFFAFLIPARGKAGKPTASVFSALPPSFAPWLALLLAALGAFSLLRQSTLAVQCYPVLMNLLFFSIFAFSLTQKQSLIERLARRQEPDLPESGVRYTRKVTLAWCVFFIVNGSLALWSIAAGEKIWALYNGGIAYLLMGLMFVGEWLIRRHVRHAAPKP